MEGVHVVHGGMGQEVWETEVHMGSRGKAPVGDLGDFVPTS